MAPSACTCDCPIEWSAQQSAPDAPWRTCDCICHESVHKFMSIWPTPTEGNPK